jgi:hypothetical protein
MAEARTPNGQGAAADAVTIGWEDDIHGAVQDKYLLHGFDGINATAQVFCHVLKDVNGDDAARALDFASQANRSGGLLAPNLQIGGLSRSLGPVAGLPAAAGEQFDDLSHLLEDRFDPGKMFAQTPRLGVQRLIRNLSSTALSRPAPHPARESGPHATYAPTGSVSIGIIEVVDVE